MLKKENGITLVALVVTIVVLLILAGVSMSMVLGNNGLVTKAVTAGNEYTNAQSYEADQFNNVLPGTINNLLNDAGVNLN